MRAAAPEVLQLIQNSPSGRDRGRGRPPLPPLRPSLRFAVMVVKSPQLRCPRFASPPPQAPVQVKKPQGCGSSAAWSLGPSLGRQKLCDVDDGVRVVFQQAVGGLVLDGPFVAACVRGAAMDARHERLLLLVDGASVSVVRVSGATPQHPGLEFFQSERPGCRRRRGVEREVEGGEARQVTQRLADVAPLMAE